MSKGRRLLELARWWLHFGVAHETPLHRPDHYRLVLTPLQQARLAQMAHQMQRLGEHLGIALLPAMERAHEAMAKFGVSLAKTNQAQR